MKEPEEDKRVGNADPQEICRIEDAVREEMKKFGQKWEVEQEDLVRVRRKERLSQSTQHHQ